MHHRLSSLPPALLLAVTALTFGCSKGSGSRQSDLGPVDPVTGVPASEPQSLPDTTPFEQTPVGIHGRLHVEGTRLVDEHGEPVQLRGVSSMWLNWENSGYASNFAALQWMRDNWGVSLIRAAMGVKDGERQPASGGYLTSPKGMTREVETIVSNAKKLGVYVVIDWHDHFAMDSVDLSQEFFSEMASKYKDDPHVIYEVFNEPVPGVFGAEERFDWPNDIKPYHETLVKTIRAEDPNGVIILGTPFWSQNVDEAAMDPVAGDNLMYTLHFYACTHDSWLRDKAQVALDMGIPLFVTEWGATDAGGGVTDTTLCLDESDAWHDFMKANWISWAAWKLDDCLEGSCLLKPNAPRNGGWDANWLQGHGPYVVEKLAATAATSTPAQSTDAGAASDGGAASGAPDAGPVLQSFDAGPAPRSDAAAIVPTPNEAGTPPVIDAAPRADGG